MAGEDFLSNLRQRMNDVHERVRVNIQNASDRMKQAYDVNAGEGGYRPGEQVWLYNPQRRRGYSPKLQTSWEGPYRIVDRRNDVVYRIQKPPRGKPRIVHFNRLAPYAGDHQEGLVRNLRSNTDEFEFEHFMGHRQKKRYGVTHEVQQDLFKVPMSYALAHCVAQDLRMSRGIAVVFKAKFGRIEDLRIQDPSVTDVLQIEDGVSWRKRSIFYLVTKQGSHEKPTYRSIWNTLVKLRDVMLSQNVRRLAIPKIGCGLDGLDWKTVRSMLEVIFRFTGIEIMVCSCNHKRSPAEKSVDCYCYHPRTCREDNIKLQP